MSTNIPDVGDILECVHWKTGTRERAKVVSVTEEDEFKNRTVTVEIISGAHDGITETFFVREETT